MTDMSIFETVDASLMSASSLLKLDPDGNPYIMLVKTSSHNMFLLFVGSIAVAVVLGPLGAFIADVTKSIYGFILMSIAAISFLVFVISAVIIAFSGHLTESDKSQVIQTYKYYGYEFDKMNQGNQPLMELNLKSKKDVANQVFGIASRTPSKQCRLHVTT